MDLQLTKKRVVITGGSRGIGFACGKAFAEAGADVTLISRQEKSLDLAIKKLKSENNLTVSTLCADLSASISPELADLVSTADILVNNAGAIPGGDLEKIDEQTWRTAWDLKVFGYINLTRAAFPAMIKRGSGVIVNIIGMAGVNPRYDYICGAAGNAALIAFTRAVGAHGSQHGVRVFGINPGPTETDRLVTLYKARSEHKTGDPEKWQDLLRGMPFDRAAKPSEIADLTLFLSSPRAGYVSGEVFNIDGGATYSA
ncbi:short-chain dehydrogenase [Robbsia andropogonis]|uniref:Short-chain dehydrogenase n=1 Tax=Robbsia andropogonis TaxID=28092 RepID=A0A0F5JV21_9BURK|nr:short-chain dehydrogenase/reductase [Robbsia andropogonis]KKB61698.1 short-chain dehydrogenase [Robbsia andropogonis]MCP1119971.1 short-chain dehydrogenase/reductase [Robbsia andropogonis]MCP1129841.1 short-chain dehydrogenase/reductase [Robbsia andropogonis]